VLKHSSLVEFCMLRQCRIKYTSVAIGKIGEIIASKVLFAGDVGDMLCFPRLKSAGNAFRSSYQNPIKVTR